MFRMFTRHGSTPRELLFMAIVAVATLGACADEQSITAPSSYPTQPNKAMGDVITVTSSRGGTEEGTLRWAVAQATGGEIIRFDARLAGATITLDSTLAIANAVTIEGPADKGVTVSGGGRGRVIDVLLNNNSTLTTTLRNLNITGGKLTTEGGAGIRASESIVLQHVTVFGNEAPNAAAILTAPFTGLTLFNSTVSGNTSTSYLAHAIRAGGGASIQHSTIAYNTQGGIGFAELDYSTLANSIVAHNGTLTNNCALAENLQLNGTNIVSDFSCGDASVVLITDPQLEPLRENGGPSLTHALGSASPAFNAGGPCGVPVDQRYQPRDAACDIGAYESTERTTVALTIDRVASLDPAGTVAVVSGTTKCSRAGDQFAVAVQVEQRGTDKTVTVGTGVVSVICTTTGAAWSALVYPSGGVFKDGNATATATTQQTPTWLAPTSASRSMKLVKPPAA
jgi:hypothetical protein